MNFPFKFYCQKVIPLAFDESMSYYEVLCALTDYIKNTLLPAVNENAQAVAELQNYYMELKNYVDTYFDNLDIQTEINNKLDEMAESGELTDIIAQYLQLAGILSFNTVTDMKAAENLANGSFVKTYGYSQLNDGLGRFYKIRTILNTDVIDDINIIALTNYNNLIAELMIDLQIKNFVLLDNFPKLNDDSSDSERIQRAIDYLHNNFNGGTLFIGYNNLEIDSTIDLYNNINIIGEGVNASKFTITEDVKLFENPITSRIDNIKINNLSIIRNITSTESLIDLQYISYSKLENLSIYDNVNNYNTIYLGEFSYYNIIDNCQIRNSSLAILLDNEANGNIIQNGSIYGCIDGVKISNSNTNRIVNHSCENLSGIAYNFINESKKNCLICPRIENCYVGIKFEYSVSGSSISNSVIFPQFYLNEGQTDIDNPVSNQIFDSNTYYQMLGNSNPSFKATKKFGQSVLVANTYTKVLFNQTTYDRNNNYNTTTDIFTANARGTYLFNGQVSLNGVTADSVYSIALYVNGTAYSEKTISSAAGSNVCVDISSLILLNKNDTVELYIKSVSGGNAILNTKETTFEGALLLR